MIRFRYTILRGALAIRCKSQLMAHHSGIQDIPEVIAHSPIVVVSADFNPAFSLTNCRLSTIQQSNAAIIAIWE